MITYGIESFFLLWCLKRVIFLYVKKIKFNQLNLFLAGLDDIDSGLEVSLDFNEIESLGVKKSFNSEIPDDCLVFKGE